MDSRDRKILEQADKLAPLAHHEGWLALRGWIEESVKYCLTRGVSGLEQRDSDMNAGAYGAYQSILDYFDKTVEKGKEIRNGQN